MKNFNKQSLQMHFATIIITISLAFMGSCTNDDGGKTTPPDSTPDNTPTEELTLKEKAKFNIGAAIRTAYLQEEDYKNTLLENFSQITAEYEMKMEVIWESPTSFNWEKSDELVNFAQENNLDVHGHTLIWYRSFPEWFKQANYDSTAFENHIKNYITTVVTRYKDKVKSWDVVNEVFADQGGYREEEIILPVFNDPIAFYGRCFQYAKEADPDALLFYNDYSVVLDGGKRNAIKDMVNRFQAENYPIDGLGDQFHYRENTPKPTMKEGFEDMASTGLLVHISEMDIIMNLDKPPNYDFNEVEAEKQKQTYKYIVEMYEDLPANQKFAISLWGITDKYTWLSDYWSENIHPLLFDANYKKKPAYEGFLEGLN